MRPLLACRPAPFEGGWGSAGHFLFYSLPAMPGRHFEKNPRTHMRAHGNCMVCPNKCKCHLIQLNTTLLGIQGSYCEAFPRVCCCHELQMLDQVFARPCGLQTSKADSGAYQGQKPKQQRPNLVLLKGKHTKLKVLVLQQPTEARNLVLQARHSLRPLP